MKNCTVICLLILTIILSSCAQTKTIVNSSYAAYKNDDFTRQDIAIKKIAILPVLVHEGKEHLRRPMEESLHKHLINSFGYLSVVSTDEVRTFYNGDNFFTQVINIPNIYDLIDHIYDTALEWDGDAFSHFKSSLETEKTDENENTKYPYYKISGLVIKRKDRD
jgi:hypothetical protein